MKIKWLLFTFLLFNLPANTTSQYPSYEWNTTELGVSIGDIFDFKLTEFTQYNGENDTFTQGNFFLNNTAVDAREKATDDEFLNVGENFSITIQSNPYFFPDYRYVYIEENDTSYELFIPIFDVSLTHNSFVADRIMESQIFSSNRPGIGTKIFESLFLIPDWEIYELLFFDEDYSKETITDEENYYITRFTRNFEIGENTIIYDSMQFANISDSDQPWNSKYNNHTQHAIIDKNTGLIKKLEWQFEIRAQSPEIDRWNIIIENIEETNGDTTNVFSLGQETYVFFSLTSFTMLTMLMVYRKRRI